MSQTSGPRSPMGGGIAIALLTVGGTIFGSAQGQPFIGLLGGFGAGIIVALLVWWADRKRR